MDLTLSHWYEILTLKKKNFKKKILGVLSMSSDI